MEPKTVDVKSLSAATRHSSGVDVLERAYYLGSSLINLLSGKLAESVVKYSKYKDLGKNLEIIA